MEENLTKICIDCGNPHVFSCKKKYRSSRPEKEYRCKSCATSMAHSGKTLTNEVKLAISKSRKKSWANGDYDEYLHKWSECKLGEKNGMYGSHRVGDKNPFYGKSHSDASKQLIREKAISRWKDVEYRNAASKSAKKRVSRTGMPSVNYNPAACKIIDEYGAKHGYNFQHAKNGGEYKIRIGDKHYFVDGYDKDKNVVIEYYEKHHKFQMNKDEIRKNEIIAKLDCEFIIIEEGIND